jgi:type I phosphodiesterase/nucleotide pyrophosphatase
MLFGNMWPDDLVLSLQSRLDHLVRRLRRGAAPTPTHRRLLIVQIDGLSRAVLEHGLASGHMPFLKHLLERHGYRVEPMAVGLPTSTPAFQMAAMYGVRPDIPGFHYYDRQRRSDIHFPRRGHAARVEAKQAAGRRGILQRGSAYGCVFTGGADNNLFTFASLTQPSGRGLLSALSPFVVVSWVALKSLALTAVELVRAVLRFVADPVGQWRGWRWLTMKIGLSVWVRGLFTLAVSRDLYAGTPAIYVNYLDYDVSAHAFGPRSRPALRSLRRVDRSLRQIFRTVRRVPEHRYDVYVLSDHGQAHCTPYRTLTGGQRLERWVFDHLLDQTRLQPPVARDRVGLARGIRARRREETGLFQHFLNYLDEDFLRRGDPEAYERNGIRVISAGPNAFLYVLDATQPRDADTLEHRFPGLAEELSQSPGIGFVLARSGEGPVCFWRGKRYPVREAPPPPIAGRPDAFLVVQGIEDLMAMPSAGDFVIYGIGAPEGHVSFIPEVGAHAGLSPEEMHTFIVHPANIILPSPIDHPVALYGHFVRYRDTER